MTNKLSLVNNFSAAFLEEVLGISLKSFNTNSFLGESEEDSL